MTLGFMVFGPSINSLLKTVHVCSCQGELGEKTGKVEEVKNIKNHSIRICDTRIRSINEIYGDPQSR